MLSLQSRRTRSLDRQDHVKWPSLTQTLERWTISWHSLLPGAHLAEALCLRLQAGANAGSVEYRLAPVVSRPARKAWLSEGFWLGLAGG